MKIREVSLHIGAEKPFDIIHASDTHLTYADGRENDNGRKLALAAQRAQYFPDAEDNLRLISETSKKLGAPVMHTGDLIDFVSAANLDAAAEFVKNHEVFMAAGNHEFSLYVGEAREDAAYRNQSLDAVQACFFNDIRFSNRVINGVNFVAVDNSYYLFEKWQLDALKAEVEKGMPVVLMMHTPVYNEEIFEKYTTLYPGEPTYLMAVPEKLMDFYTPERFEQQLADDVTRAAFDYIISENRIAAILAGHLHTEMDSHLPDGRHQFVPGIEEIRIIHID